jgi:hypothetical protein
MKAVVGVAAVVVVGSAIGVRAYEHRMDLPRPSCGSAGTHDLDRSTQLLSADPGALACFHAAAKSCRAASIEVGEGGVDTSTGYVFVITPGGRPCQVTEFSQFSFFTGQLHRNPVTSTRCRIAAVTAQGVTLGCGGQQLLVPATVSHREAGG